MTIKEKNQVVYQLAYNYLLDILPNKLNADKLQKYFSGDRRDFSSLADVYEQLIHSAQNYQRMPNVIKFTERKEKIKSILCEYDLTKITTYNIEDLYQVFRKEFNVTSEDSKRNSWHKWSKSIIDAAKFMSDFENISDFKTFVNQFDYNLPSRMALPLLISTKISGIGFALACDFLKELGYVNYPKPDVHLIDVFNRLGLSERNPVSVFEAIVKMSDDCKEIDKSITPYKIDKIIWLICSGNFYHDEITNVKHKEDFITMAADHLDKIDDSWEFYPSNRMTVCED